MKKAIFTLLLMAGLFNFTACTEESLAEATNSPEDYYANDNENNDPEEEKPEDDN